jgi:hypothetical protein
MKQKTLLGLVAGIGAGLLPVAMGVALLPARPAVAQAQTKQAAPFAAVRTAWAKIEASAADLDKTIAAGKLGEVHEIAFAIRDDVVTLPAKSAALPADKKKKLTGYVQTVSATAKGLDEAGDSKNLKGVKAGQARMKATLQAIKTLYPAGTFAATSGSKMSPMNGKKRDDMKGMKM